MQKNLIILALVALLAPVASFATPQYATTVEGTYTTSSVDSKRDNPEDALGEQNWDGNFVVEDGVFYSLSQGGWLVVSFGTQFSGNGSVFEVTFNSRQAYTETAEIWVSNNWISTEDSGRAYDATYLTDTMLTNDIAGLNFQYAAEITNENDPSTFTITLPGTWTYLAIVDTSSTKDGFDVDAISVTPVPEPATMLLFGTGIMGLATLARRRQR